MERLEAAGYEVDLLSKSYAEDELVREIADCVAIGIRSKTYITPRVMEAAKQLRAIGADYDDELIKPRGRGIMQGLNCHSGKLAADICRRAFRKGLVIETSGSESQVVKCLPPLTTPREVMIEALGILREAVKEAIESYRPGASRAA